MKSFINFEGEGINVTFKEIQNFDITCKKCGQKGVEILPSFWYGGGEKDGVEIEFRCNQCDVSETIEDN